MIVFTADCDREEAAASMALTAGAGAGAGAGKKKEAGASERRVPLACLLPNQSKAGARPVGAGKKMEEATAGKKKEEATATKKKMKDAASKKMKEATAKKMKEATAEKMEGAVVSESGDAALGKKKDGDSLWKEGEMLKLRVEFWQAENLWMRMREKAIRGTTVESKIKQVPAPAVNNKSKLVRVIWPDACIDDIIEDPCMIAEPSDEEMAELPKEYRQSYAMLKIVNAKKRAYHQALIEQHRAFGFAYDEVEVTDDDEKEVTEDQEEMAAAKN